MSSTIHLVIHDSNKSESRSRFRAEDDTKTLKDIIHDRCDKMKIPFPELPLHIYVQQENIPHSRAPVADINDFMELNREYFIFHPDFDKLSTENTSVSDVIEVTASSEIPEGCSNSPNASPADEVSVASEIVESEKADKEQLPFQLHFSKQHRCQFLSELYFANRDVMEKAFEELKPDQPFYFYEIDIVKEFSIPQNIAALVLLKNQHLMSYDYKINDVVRDVCQGALVNVVDTIQRKLHTNPQRKWVQPLLDFMFNITQNEFFKLLDSSDNPLLAAARKRKERRGKKDGSAFKKKPKLNIVANFDEVNDASNALSAATTPEEIENLMKRSCAVRCNWIKSMEEENKNRIPESVVQKFPELLRNAFLLHYDFQYVMDNFYKLPQFNVKEALETHATAIISLAKDHKIISREAETDATDLYEILKLLVNLLSKYDKKCKNCRIERLVAESQNSPSVEAMTQKRREICQQAPMIFIVETFPEKHFYVSTDDVSFKANGGFGDVLQSLYELHYVFNLDYAKEMKDIMMIIEHLCGLHLKNVPKARSRLFLDLKSKLS